MQRMKILHVIFSMQIGGAESMLVDILNQQIRYNDFVYLLIINKDYNPNLLNTIDPKVNIICLNRKIGSKFPFFLLKLYIYLLKIKPEVIHCHDHSIVRLFNLTKIRKVLTLHTICLDKNKEVNNWMKYDKICAISKFVINDAKNLMTPDLSSVLIYNGVDFNSIIYASRNKKIKEYYKIVQISRIEHLIKGQDILIKALSFIKEKYSINNITIDFIGEGSSLDYLKSLAVEFGVSDSVNFLGAKDRSYIYQNLCNYDLLVQPSRYEGFGLTVVEAMAAKVPMLVSNIDGPMEIIENGRFGYFFESENIEDCARKILDIIASDNPILIEEAYKYAYDNFNIEKTVLQYLQVYKKNVGEH